MKKIIILCFAFILCNEYVKSQPTYIGDTISGTLNYGVMYGNQVQINALSGSSFKGKVISRTGFAGTYSATGYGYAYCGYIEGLSKLKRIKSGSTYALGGSFSVSMDNLTTQLSGGAKCDVAGVKGQIRGTISSLANSTIVSAVYGSDLINTSKTYAGYFDGKLRVTSLSGNGNMMVVADNNGVLSKQAIPTSGGTSLWTNSGTFAYYNSGNVGIGTASPSKKLDVKGDINFTGNLYKNGTLVNTGSSSVWSKNGNLAYYNSGNVGIRTSNPSTSLEIRNGILKLTGHSFIGQSTGHGSAAARFMIDAGISVGHPFLSFKNDDGVQMFVHADGTIVCNNVRTKEIWVEEVLMPDYVFEDDYYLRSLSEVENFITENKHLPGIPSAKQVEEEGMGLKEMNNLLLQKVEELTLYIIDLENRVAEIEKQ